MNHDAISVQMCLSAGLNESQADQLLSRLSLARLIMVETLVRLGVITEDMQVAGIRALTVARDLLGTGLSDEALVSAVFTSMLAVALQEQVK